MLREEYREEEDERDASGRTARYCAGQELSTTYLARRRSTAFMALA